jgi:hypothetical protein
VDFLLSSPYLLNSNLNLTNMNANAVKQNCEELEVGFQATRARFKPGAELSKSVVRFVDVKIDEHENEGRDIFIVKMKVCYEQQKAGSAE